MRVLATFALIVLGFAGDALAQSCASTQGQLELCKSLTNAVRFGFPRYTTAQLPTCNANNTGAVAYDTTAGSFKNCDGSAWAAFAGGGGSTAFSSITSGTNTGAAMLVGTGASLGPTGTGTIAATSTDIFVANEGITGTTTNYLAKLTGAPSTAIVAGTSDTSGIVGLVVSGAGTTGSALIARSGSASCAFDGSTTAGDYVIVSTTAAGKCHDTGAATYPTGAVQVLGRVLSTNVGAGTYAMTLHMGTQGFQGSGTANTISKWTTGGLAQTDSGVTDDGTTVTSTENVVVGSNAAGKNLTVNATLGAEIAPSLATGANWTSGAGWTAGNPAGIKGSDGTGTLTPASGATVVAGTTYKVVITLSAWSVGSASVKLGGDTLAMSLAAATTYTEFFTPTTTTTAIVITPTNTARFTISSISYKALTDATGDAEVQGDLTVRSAIRANGPILARGGSSAVIGGNNLQYGSADLAGYGVQVGGGGSARVNFVASNVAYGFVDTSGITGVGTVAGTSAVANGAAVLTAGTMTASSNVGRLLTATNSFQWTNAMVTALGATTAGDITVATLPAKTQVVDVQVVILTAAGGTTTLTVACGRTAAGYIDYIVASDAQAAANTVYGDAAAERGTNLTGYDIPSYTGTTPLVCHFISTGSNLSAVTTSTGRVIVTSRLLP